MKFLFTALISIILVGVSSVTLATSREAPGICLPATAGVEPITDNLRSYDSTSSLPNRIAPQGERVFIFSPRLLRWAAYDRQGYRVASGKANGGSHHCKDLDRPCRTPLGSHRIHSKGTASCISNKFPLPNGGAPMPYCMFFRGGYAIHGSPYISNNNTSHGCIRVHTAAAQWLHRYFLRHGTKVVVLPY